jgi:hypothetical protein
VHHEFPLFLKYEIKIDAAFYKGSITVMIYIIEGHGIYPRATSGAASALLCKGHCPQDDISSHKS